MSRFIKISLAVSLATATLLTPVSTMAAVPDYSTNVDSLVNYLKANQAADGSITGFGGETAWAVMGFASNGVNPNSVQNSGVSVIDFLKNNPPGTVSGWERDLLAVTAAGENPFTFGGHNYVSAIQSSANSNQLGSISSINDDTFGILALISAGASANQTIISESVDFVIANQNADGGWGYNVGVGSDNGSTAIAILSLEAAKDNGFSNSGLLSAISHGKNYLEGNQNPDGGWGYAGLGFSDAASTAWAMLVTLGDDSATTAALDFNVTKQDASGGIDGGFGVDTYTSANSLIAFGQKAFPIGAFDGIFQENENPREEPVSTPSAKPADPNNPPGQVLAANTSSDQNGQVLAALPDTGISDTNFESPLVNLAKQPTINKVFLAAMLMLELGLILKLLAGRLKKSSVN
ncbi:MAG TPA: prenyltransferase/squalene oxidase repeat-containing protein [Candidatus Saccharimonadales bacterium]|nr:prenyltransferase/squalene oxidase repeat-containing protein [Candidatus Saccharimonadales bacterium]